MPDDFTNTFKRLNRTAFAALLAFLLIPNASTANAAEDTNVGKIQLAYQLNLAGFRFARIYMNSYIQGDNYRVDLTAKSSSFAKLYPFHGTSRSIGTMVGDQAQSTTYNLTYETVSRNRQVDLAFSGTNVTDVDIQPPAGSPVGRAPLLPEHREDVSDPISAFILPFGDGEPDGAQACNREQEIFDGRHRFKISMNYIRTISRPSTERPGNMVPVFVCSLKYTPIAGHRINRDNEMFDWANNDGVEFWLMPVYVARVFVPIYGSFPTPLGNAVFQTNSMVIKDF
ncbi:MAG: DUF3108 domain-containing protein [Rhizobiales bacterium]|nr:DUF3108 domain-containing protein [Hyphomicrobiales bacterium]